jgi:hypothetical protein
VDKTKEIEEVEKWLEGLLPSSKLLKELKTRATVEEQKKYLSDELDLKVCNQEGICSIQEEYPNKKNIERVLESLSELNKPQQQHSRELLGSI